MDAKTFDKKWGVDAGPSAPAKSFSPEDFETKWLRAKPTEETAPVETDSVKEFGRGVAHGFVKAFSHIGSAVGQGAQIEMGQPVDVPGPDQTFDIVQKNLTGALPPGAGTAGQLGGNIGGTLPYMLTLPSVEGLMPRLVQSGLIGAGATAGENLSKGTPYEGIGGLVGGIAAPTAVPYLAGKTMSAGGKALANLAGGFSGVGPTPVAKAFASGASGEGGGAFRAAIKGETKPEQIIDEANTALTNMRIERGKQYRSDMKNLAEDGTVLSFKPIDEALEKAQSIKTFKGQNLSPETKDVQDQVSKAITDWKGLDPSEYHTPVGMDALKQRLGSIKDSLPFGTPQRKVADDAYNAVRQTIVKQAPKYSEAMKGYEEASSQIDEIKKTLSLNPKASVDTAFRKLLSTMRNNANTNYGQRASLVKQLEEHGAPHLSASLAGHSMQSWLPHGLARGVPAMELGGIALSAALGHPEAALALASLPLQSPRLVGSAAHGMGRIYGSVAPSLGSTASPLNSLIAAFGNRPNQLEKLTNGQIPYRPSGP